MRLGTGSANPRDVYKRQVELLADGKTNRLIGIRNGKMCDVDIEQGLAETKGIDKEELTVLEAMTCK